MNKHTNKILLIVLLVLLSAFVVTKVFRTPARESNLDADLFHIDTSQVELITLQLPGSSSEELTFKKNDSTWTIRQENKSANVEEYQLDQVLGTMNNIKPERMVSRKKDNWDEYHVGDSLAIRLTAYTADMDELGSWRIGRESAGNTYIRSEDRDEVYVVGGNLRSRFDKDFNDWRDKSFLRIDKAFIDKITFHYPADSGFVVEKDGRTWMIGNQKADSAKVENYLYKLQSKDLSGFADEFSPSADPDITVEFSSNSVPHAVVKAWNDPAGRWILNSAFQPGVYFQDSVFWDDIFVGKKVLLGE